MDASIKLLNNAMTVLATLTEYKLMYQAHFLLIVARSNKVKLKAIKTNQKLKEDLTFLLLLYKANN